MAHLHFIEFSFSLHNIFYQLLAYINKMHSTYILITYFLSSGHHTLKILWRILLNKGLKISKYNFQFWAKSFIGYKNYAADFFLSANFALKENETLTNLYLNTIYNQNRHHFLQLCFKKKINIYNNIISMIWDLTCGNYYIFNQCSPCSPY